MISAEPRECCSQSPTPMPRRSQLRGACRASRPRAPSKSCAALSRTRSSRVTAAGECPVVAPGVRYRSPVVLRHPPSPRRSSSSSCIAACWERLGRPAPRTAPSSVDDLGARSRRRPRRGRGDHRVPPGQLDRSPRGGRTAHGPRGAKGPESRRRPRRLHRHHPVRRHPRRAGALPAAGRWGRQRGARPRCRRPGPPINLLAAFIPAAVLGLAFGDTIDEHLLDPGPVAGALIVGGIAILVLTPWLAATGTRTGVRSRR